MINEILTYLLPLGKFLLASALLVLFYQLMYNGKSMYNQSRVYLLSIALISVMISQFRVVVNTPPVRVVEVEKPGKVVRQKSLIPTLIRNEPDKSMTLQPEELVSRKVAQAFVSYVKVHLTIQKLVLLTYAIVTLLLFLSLYIQYFKVHSIKRKGVVRRSEDLELEIVENTDVLTPFSFGRTIFIGNNLSGNKMEVVLKHEAWHIRHYHYLDVLLMEVFVRLFWFNPVLWWVRKELRNISEFQADRSVLDEGHDLYMYQTLILEEVMEQNPFLANGFNNSFTKKRFIRMKNKNICRFKSLRTILVIPFLFGLFSLFCFAQGKQEVRYVIKNPTKGNGNAVIPSDLLAQSQPLVSEMSADSICNDSMIRIKHSKMNWEIPEIDETFGSPDIFIDDTIELYGLVLSTLDKALNAKTPTLRNKNIVKVYSLFKMKLNNASIVAGPTTDVLCASITNQDLKVSKNQLMQMQKRLNGLRNEKSESEKTRICKELVFQLTETPVVYKFFNTSIDQMKQYMQPSLPINAMNTVNVVNPGSDSFESAEQSEDRENQNEEKSKFSYVGFGNKPILLEIDFTSKDETRVTFGVPFHNSLARFHILNSLSIFDKQTREFYPIRCMEVNQSNEIGVIKGDKVNDGSSLRGKWNLDKEYQVIDFKNKIMKVTLHFPPLKKSVKYVNIQDYTIGEVDTTGVDKPWFFEDIKLGR